MKDSRFRDFFQILNSEMVLLQSSSTSLSVYPNNESAVLPVIVQCLWQKPLSVFSHFRTILFVQTQYQSLHTVKQYLEEILFISNFASVYLHAKWWFSDHAKKRQIIYFKKKTRSWFFCSTQWY